jgi:5'-deoxynucleotidase YfbR-like HD superfamily hydrolase
MNLAAPDMGLITPEDIATVLSRVPRWGGHGNRTVCVAAHSLYVAKLVPKRLRAAALLHDAHEAFTGDLLGPLTRLAPEMIRLNRSLQIEIERAAGIRVYAEDRDEIERWDLYARNAEKAYVFGKREPGPKLATALGRPRRKFLRAWKRYGLEWSP